MVTGASDGLGKEIAMCYAKNGMKSLYLILMQTRGIA
ncbi:hypothetical protein [Paenibacillus planticolens]